MESIQPKLDMRCGICLSFLVEPVTFPCKHEVCHACYQETMDKSNMNCPFCRKRLSVWARKSAKLKTLINENKWKEICNMFPEQVRRAMEAGDEDVDEEVTEIKRIISEPGEIGNEFQELIRRDLEQRQQEAKLQEERSIQYIQQHFQT